MTNDPYLRSFGHFRKNLRSSNRPHINRCSTFDDTSNRQYISHGVISRNLNLSRILNDGLALNDERNVAGTVNLSNGRNNNNVHIKYPVILMVSTIVTFCGTFLYFGCLFMALSITRQMFRKAYENDYEFEWFKMIQTLVIVLSVLMGSLSIVLLIFGCLVLGTSRSHIYSGFKSMRGAQITLAVFTCIVYVLFLVWFGISLMLIVPIVGFYMLNKHCDEKLNLINNHLYMENQVCISLNSYGISKASVCSNELVSFCSHVGVIFT
jgi:hypothetical protein